jgi:hypothetical protein
MALTLTNSNYGGEVLEKIFLELGLGNEIAKENIAQIITDQAGDFSLPKMAGSSLPIGVYTQTAPTADTVTIAYSERKLSMTAGTIYLEFVPSLWHGTLWKLWQSVGDFTNLELNTKLVSAILDLIMDKAGMHYSLLAFQGDKNLAASTKMHFIDGWVTRAIADANVIKPTPAGNITANNFADILAAVWSAIPSHLIKDPDFTLKVDTAVWKLMQTSNIKLQEAFAGVLGSNLADAKYLTSKIIPFDGMKSNHIFGSKSDNLFAGFWVDLENEGLRIDRVANNSHTWFMRLDIKMDVNYVAPNELVLYEPTA